MAKTRKLRPWHEVVRLKQELRTGELSLAEFAADLHEVTLAQGRASSTRIRRGSSRSPILRTHCGNS